MTVVKGSRPFQRHAPSFTHTRLKARGAAALPPGFTAFDRAVLPITLAALVAWVFAPDRGATAALTALAALARIGAALLADLYDPLLTLAAAAWIGAFAAFLAVCGPMLLAPRPAREPD